MWNLPGSGIEPLSPALTGRFFTTEPPGKPMPSCFKDLLVIGMGFGPIFGMVKEREILGTSRFALDSSIICLLNTSGQDM